MLFETADQRWLGKERNRKQLLWKRGNVEVCMVRVIPHFQWGPLVELRSHFQFDSGCDAAAGHVVPVVVVVQSHSVACS